MNHDDFIETVLQKISQDLGQAYAECSHSDHTVDYAKLNEKIESIFKSAKLEGVKEKIFIDALKSAIPSDSHAYIFLLLQQAALPKAA
jgi:hypothetical protein